MDDIYVERHCTAQQQPRNASNESKVDPKEIVNDNSRSIIRVCSSFLANFSTFLSATTGRVKVPLSTTFFTCQI